MLCRVLLDLWAVRSSALLTLHTGKRETTHTFPWVMGHTRSQLTLGSTGVTGHCYLSSGQTLGSRDSEGYANDPQVKEWMKELQQDFNHQLKEEEKKDLVSGKTEEGEDREKEKNVVDGLADGEKKRKETGSNPQKGVL